MLYLSYTDGILDTSKIEWTANVNLTFLIDLVVWLLIGGLLPQPTVTNF